MNNRYVSNFQLKSDKSKGCKSYYFLIFTRDIREMLSLSGCVNMKEIEL